MGNQFREAIFKRLRPHLRILGNRREGFYFEPKPHLLASASTWSMYCSFIEKGQLQCEWSYASAANKSMSLYGDADLWVRRFGSSGTWCDFVSEVLLHCHDVFGASSYCRFHYRPVRVQRASMGWPVLLKRCGQRLDPKAVFGGRSPGPIKEYLTLRDDGNTLMVLIRGGGYRIFNFCTS